MNKSLSLVLIVACISVVAAQKTTEEQQRLNVVNLLTDIYNGLIAEPTNVLTSSLASLLVQVTAGVALEGLGGIGKRSVESSFKEIVENWINNALPAIIQHIRPYAKNTRRDVDEQELRGLVSSIVDALYPIVDQHVKGMRL